MKRIHFRHISILILLFLIMHTLVPVHAPQDANKDRVVDIRDAVIRAKQLAAGDHQNSGSALSAFISTVQVVAGMKTVLQSQDHENIAKLGGNLFYMGREMPQVIKVTTASVVRIVDRQPESIISAPPVPPPC